MRLTFPCTIPPVIAMARSPTLSKGETFTFRLDPALKAALAASATEQHKQPGELVRELLRAHVAQRERHAFEEEARRQSAIINAAGQDPQSDEAQVMGELNAHLDQALDEWN